MAKIFSTSNTEIAEDHKDSEKLLSHAGAPETISGKRFFFKDCFLLFEEIFCCCICFIVAIYISLFICICVVLDRSNNDSVKKLCGGFWEFMIVALVSPIIIPCLYCLYGCFFLFVCTWKWKVFSSACMLVMGVGTLHLCINVSENANCLQALRESTPPLPWLLYAGWVKTIFFFSGSFSLIYDEYFHKRPEHEGIVLMDAKHGMV